MKSVSHDLYDDEGGWSPFPGYLTQQFKVSGSLPPSIDTVLRAGVDLTASTPTVAIDASILRFDRYLVISGESSPIQVTWKRERASARERSLILFLEQGTLLVRSGQRHVRLEPSQIAIVPPGSEPVFLSTHRKIAGVMFSFDVKELEPLRPRWYHSDGGIVRDSVRTLLDTAVNAPPAPDPHSANSLRALLRAAAHALIVEATNVADLRDADTLALVQLIVENRFQVAGFGVDGIARESGLTRRVLERRLRLRGTSVAGVLRRRRIENAEALMGEEPSLSAREVALRSGFASAITMRRAIATEARREEKRPDAISSQDTRQTHSDRVAE
ncbi:hypothetical protein C5E07_05140 [Pseudoclavibacter sp. RFBJ3]|uniref:helix-turn-helix domain-containing protein n=1 Tax=unclassified Pseudoclavibacter TaxID=2615177 RepID=UPI000CE826F4|nr:MULTISPECIES: helix-turn-helix domain-containing protein [unclassified Pseudoclavibacter]PPF84888.1 hypothetical protein C5C12_05845 [Pseudoclavibacter sp. RFBJ5]PPF93892.1 hypothetical protein C5E07_05140 [Pseudoclavibacter sp. RFBJ3]PPF98610.1 hypothetical protein C5C19_08125 [Pseudoclavibacter sp. RFBH5]PPG24429.1 hypothetical protein C5E13_06745 [Pseudoclavibacter sp. RFBI4]